MKKTFTFLTFVILFFSSQFLFSQPWSEDFNTQTSNSYGTGTITINGRDWTRKDAGNFSYANTNMGSYAFTINDDKPGAHVTSPALNTCGTISFKYAYKSGSSSNVFVLQKSYDNSSWTDLDTHTLGASSNLSYVNYSYDVNDAATTIYIRILSDDQDAHLFIEDYSVTAYSASSNDQDAKAADTGSQPAAGTISSVDNDDSSNPIDVFNMTIYDNGTSDGLSTKVTNIRLKPKNTNTASWSANIQGVVVDDGTNYLTPNSVTITDTEIDIAFSSTELNVADNSTTTVNIAVYLNTSNIEDGKKLSFMVDVDDHGFTADASGTGFMADFGGGDFYSNDFTIEVEATEMQFQQQPTDVNVNEVMTPAITVEYIDANGNVDVDYDGTGYDVSMTTTGTFAGSATTSVEPALGIATFDNLVFSAIGTDETITADNDGWTTPQTVTSNTFDVTDLPTTDDVRINELDSDTPGTDSEEFIELYGTSNYDLTGLVLVLYNGSNDNSYKAWDLDGYSLDANGYFILGNSGAPGNPDITFSDNFLQNGADAVALYQGDGADFPNGTAVTSDNLIDALVYDTNDSDDSGLLNGLNQTEQINEKENSSSESESIQRGSWFVSTPTPRSENTLPVKLIKFNIIKDHDNTKILWKTALEINNDYFSVEWSKDGKYFSEIAKIKSKGNHRENQEYSYTHTNPANGINYYRLTQYDLDGRSETFNIVSVSFDSQKKSMFIVPNRVDNNLRVEFNQPVENGRLHIYNMEGQLIQSNVLAIGIDVINIDVSGLISGQYIAKYIDVTGAITKKFIKL